MSNTTHTPRFADSESSVRDTATGQFAGTVSRLGEGGVVSGRAFRSCCHTCNKNCTTSTPKDPICRRLLGRPDRQSISLSHLSPQSTNQLRPMLNLVKHHQRKQTPNATTVNCHSHLTNRYLASCSGTGSQRVCYARCHPQLQPKCSPTASSAQSQWSMELETSNYPQALCRQRRASAASKGQGLCVSGNATLF